MSQIENSLFLHTSRAQVLQSGENLIPRWEKASLATLRRQFAPQLRKQQKNVLVTIFRALWDSPTDPLPAARSGLNSPESATSYANRLTAASPTLTVFKTS